MVERIDPKTASPKRLLFFRGASYEVILIFIIDDHLADGVSEGEFEVVRDKGVHHAVMRVSLLKFRFSRTPSHQRYFVDK